MSGPDARKLGSAKLSNLRNTKVLQHQPLSAHGASVEVVLPIPMSATGMACAQIVTKLENGSQ